MRTFKAGARGIVGVQREGTAAAKVTRFRATHREARLARRAGDLGRAYPYGTYAARVYQGAPVESEPPTDAVLAKPGLTLEEVKEQLEAERESRDSDARAPERHALLDAVGAAWTEEAGAVVERTDLEMRRVAGVDAADASAAQELADVQVRHRFDPRPRQRPGAARLVTLRDRRRGRPRRSDPSGRSDPPG